MNSPARVAAVALLALLGVGVGVAQAAAARLPLLAPKPAARVIAPVADPIQADPANGLVRGTVIMIHAGGWAGHDAYAQGLLLKTPGALFLDRGWRVVSIDYNEGTQGLQDVLAAARAELARGTPAGPLCLYGESAGAHLSLVAAAQLPEVDCVIGLGTPTDIDLYRSEGATSPDPRVRLAASQASRFFGTTVAATAPWNPVLLAPKMHADVLLLNEADDTIVPLAHTARFVAARRTTQTALLDSGDPADPSTKFVHGTVSEAGRTRYDSTIGSFADRAVVAGKAERRATRTGCLKVERSLAEVGETTVQRALRCLARGDARSLRAGKGEWHTSSFRLRGEINAARIWSHLRETSSGRRALVAASKRRAKITVRASDRSLVTLRTTR
ncbi:MAG: hypothetical protein M3376_04860 [Actinomycetota bacterium]|nr:hypothetical protein [Actinomycetota bacterium]